MQLTIQAKYRQRREGKTPEAGAPGKERHPDPKGGARSQMNVENSTLANPVRILHPAAGPEFRSFLLRANKLLVVIERN